MERITGASVLLRDETLLQKENDNAAYLSELSSSALLQDYYLEAGLNTNFGSREMKHGGWEDPSCQLRGHFLGHFLSAAAIRYDETGDRELKAKAECIVSELAKCQEENGGEWAASIPEKYFAWIARGKQVWAPHYTVHKTFMGLLDMYRYCGCEEALTVARRFSLWFHRYAMSKSREEMDRILDFETGGMLEIWADLYEFTGEKMYLELIDKYDRHRLFDPLLEGVDVLTNMHANTTIPEAIGAARVYEVTGKERYREIALRYWDLAYTKRNTFATGGQTTGEVWTPLQSMAGRLGDKNQEHCTVYNMMRLADILFTWTGDHRFLDYLEQNLYNGILSQGYYRGSHVNGFEDKFPLTGLITYFQPLRAGWHKGWGTKFSDFFCCHGTLVQANAAHNRFLYYRDGEDRIFTGIYADSALRFTVNGKSVTLTVERDTLTGNRQLSSVNSAKQEASADARLYPHQPDRMNLFFTVSAEADTCFTLYLRLPYWLRKEPSVFLNGELLTESDRSEEGFLGIRRVFRDGDTVLLSLPLTLYTTPLPGDERLLAFSYGPLVLAGLSDSERTLYLKGHAPEELLLHENEREWASWKDTFITRFQDPAIRFVPLCMIGYENYQVYFPTE